MEQVTEGVYRIGTYWSNFYLVEDAGALTFVDTGFPGYSEMALAAIDELGRKPSDVKGIVLTHTHSDHIGGVSRFGSKIEAPVFVHRAEAGIATGTDKAAPPAGFVANAWRPHMLKLVAHAIKTGGAGQPTVPHANPYGEDEALDLPGKPRTVFCPGHSRGHSAVVLEDRGVLFSGDALATLSVRDGATGPRLHPFNEDPAGARESLSVLESINARIVLPGHGEPFHGSPAEAVRLAR